VRRGRGSESASVGLIGTVAVHALAGLFLVAGAAAARKPVPPTYRVHLVAAPEPAPDARKAPEAVDRPAEDKPAPAPKAKSPKSTVSPAPPPPVADNAKREAAPRTTPNVAPLPGEKPSTGTDVATERRHIGRRARRGLTLRVVAQVLRVWQRPLQSTPLEAEVSFLVHRDGSVSDLTLLKRSGNYAFDLEAQGAIEQVGRIKAFRALPDGWTADVLFVRFYFSGRRQ